jgi:hypothetical protein
LMDNTSTSVISNISGCNHAETFILWHLLEEHIFVLL